MMADGLRSSLSVVCGLEDEDRWKCIFIVRPLTVFSLFTVKCSVVARASSILCQSLLRFTVFIVSLYCCSLYIFDTARLQIHFGSTPLFAL